MGVPTCSTGSWTIPDGRGRCGETAPSQPGSLAHPLASSGASGRLSWAPAWTVTRPLLRLAAIRRMGKIWPGETALGVQSTASTGSSEYSADSSRWGDSRRRPPNQGSGWDAGGSGCQFPNSSRNSATHILPQILLCNSIVTSEINSCFVGSCHGGARSLESDSPDLHPMLEV